jgi:hypothetical protein
VSTVPTAATAAALQPFFAVPLIFDRVIEPERFLVFAALFLFRAFSYLGFLSLKIVRDETCNTRCNTALQMLQRGKRAVMQPPAR